MDEDQIGKSVRTAMKLTTLNDQDRAAVDRIGAIPAGKTGGIDLAQLKRVILEIHNYCNRKCIFCLNATIDRRSRKDLMDQKMFHSILEQLAAENFGGALMFGRFHEPLSDPVIISYVLLARTVLPSNRITLNTNGDFFSRDFVGALFENGLSDMNVMVYLSNGRSFSDDAIAAEARRFAKKHGLRLVRGKSVAGQMSVFEVILPAELRGRVFLHGENYSIPGLGCDRGGILDSVVSKDVREASCSAPFFEVNIDFNGDMMPCCNLLSDVPSHNRYRMGNIRENGLKEIYFSELAIQFRSWVSRADDLPPACLTCQYYWPNRPNYKG